MSEDASSQGPRWTGAPPGVPVLYYEDLEDGHEQWGGEIVVDREEILAHAKEYDPWPFHTDDEAAKESVFCGLVASGGYTINLWFKLGHQQLNVETMGEIWALMGGIEWQLRFVRGVSPGMRLRFMRRVTGKRTSSKPGRGVLFLHSEIVDQDSGDPVMTIDEVALIARKASG